MTSQDEQVLRQIVREELETHASELVSEVLQPLVENVQLLSQRCAAVEDVLRGLIDVFTPKKEPWQGGD